MSNAFRVRVIRICAALHGAEVSDPWGNGHDARKVGAKMLACIGAIAQGVSEKTDGVETTEMPKATGVAVHAPFVHRSWVRLPENTGQADLTHCFVASCDFIRAKLSAVVRRAPPERVTEA